MKSPLEFWVFLPQMRLTMDQMVERARAAEAAGFAGVAGMDHLTPPLAESQPMFEAMVTNTWLASQHRAPPGRVTGPLRLIPAPRRPGTRGGHPRPRLGRPVRARDRLGLGRRRTGDVRRRVTGGKGPTGPAARIARDHQGALDRRSRSTTRASTSACTAHSRCPAPSGTFRSSSEEPARGRCAGRRARRLVERAHAHRRQARRDAAAWQETPAVRSRRRSHSSRPPDARDEIEATARRRFGTTPIVGTAPELVDYFGSLQARGVERVYVWFCDFAAPDTLAAFGDGVIGQFEQSATTT